MLKLAMMGSTSNRLQITINIHAPAFIRFKDSGLNLEELPVHKIYCCQPVFRKFQHSPVTITLLPFVSRFDRLFCSSNVILEKSKEFK